MDNDIKVGNTDMDDNNEKDCRNEVLLFLSDELQPLKNQKSSASYDLVTEYGKTRKNKSLFIPLVLAACFAVVITGAVFTIKEIQKQNSQISVNLAEFDDVNLRNLVDTVARTQDQYEAAVKSRAELQGDLDAAVAEARAERESELYVIDSLNLGKKDTAARKTQVQKTYAAAVNKAHAMYDGKITEISSEIASFKEQLDSYDEKKVLAAKERDTALDSERQLQLLERKKLEDGYEKRITELQNAMASLRNKTVSDTKTAVTQVTEKYQREIGELQLKLTGLENEKSSLQSQIQTMEQQQQALQAENTRLAAEKTALETEKQTLEADKAVLLTEKATIQSETAKTREAAIEGLLVSSGASAVVLKNDQTTLDVYIALHARYLLSSGSVPASVISSAGEITGIVTQDGSRFVFTPSGSGDAAVSPATLSAITAGNIVKILSK